MSIDVAAVREMNSDICNIFNALLSRYPATHTNELVKESIKIYRSINEQNILAILSDINKGIEAKRGKNTDRIIDVAVAAEQLGISIVRVGNSDDGEVQIRVRNALIAKYKDDVWRDRYDTLLG